MQKIFVSLSPSPAAVQTDTAKGEGGGSVEVFGILIHAIVKRCNLDMSSENEKGRLLGDLSNARCV